MKRINPWVIFALVCALLAVELFWAWQVLPERVFMFWNTSRQPGTVGGEWAGKAKQFGTLGVRVFITVLPPLLWAWLLPHRAWKFANLPHRDYWLAPERQAQTVRTFQQQAILLATCILAVWASVPYLMVQINRSFAQAGRMIGWVVGGVFVLFLFFAVYVGKQNESFKHPPQT